MNSCLAASVRLLSSRATSVPSLGKVRLHLPASESRKASYWFGMEFESVVGCRNCASLE